MIAEDSVKFFDWDDAKNATLRAERGIGFEHIIFHMQRGDLLDILEHPNPARYAGQRIFVVRREDDVYLNPELTSVEQRSTGGQAGRQAGRGFDVSQHK